MAGLGASLMPRTAAARASGAPWYSPRVGIASIMDQASLPGRAYASLGRMEDESYLDALGRTGPRYVVGQGEGDEMADAILRDPLTPVGLGLGSLLKGVRPVVGMASDLGSNAAGMAADQYATTGAVNGGEIGAGAGMGALLGLGGMAKGGKRSMISPEEREANLRAWFDEKNHPYPEANPLSSDLGKTPRIFYHGTTSSFDIPDIARAGKNFGADKTAVRGHFYVSENPEYAARYADPEDMASSYGMKTAEGEQISSSNIMPVYIKANKLFDYEDKRLVRMTAKELKLSKTDTDRLARGDYHMLESDKFQDFLKSRGYDGFSANEHGNRNYAVFDPTQIKSATGNRGTFDPNDPNITRFARASSAPSSNRAATRLERQAAQVAYDKYGRAREESAAFPVPSFQGLGIPMSSQSDTFYTRGRR